VEFLIDRIKHQQYIREYQPLACDRYIWTGLAYCKVFSPEFYPFLESLYCHDFFDRPDHYVFVDTPIEVCMQRSNRAQTEAQLIALRQAFLDTQAVVTRHTKVIVLPATKPIDDLVKDLGKDLYK
jgi:thymidylate kinase